jgi:hypothetical protein
MLWAIVLATFVLWMVAFAVFHTAASLVQVVLILAAAAALYDFITDQHRAA